MIYVAIAAVWLVVSFYLLCGGGHDRHWAWLWPLFVVFWPVAVAWRAWK